MIRGIDVSTFQGKIDWERVKAEGVQFAILRAGYGRDASQKDARFEENYAGCRRAGIPIGAYWYSYAVTDEDALREAKACLAVLKGKQFDYPVYYDVEDSSQAVLPGTRLEKIVKTFCTEMEKAGSWVGLYSYRNLLVNKFSDALLKRYAVWTADYTENTSFPYSHGLRQYTNQGRIAGIDGNVDMNYAYTDYPSQMKKAGLNNFSDGGPDTGSDAGKPILYTIQTGDTLTRIAARFDTDIDRIIADNREKYPSMTADYIQAGWILRISG